MQPERLFDRRAPLALVVALVTLALSGLGFRRAVEHFNVHLVKRPVELRRHFSSIPRRLGEWVATLDDITLDEASVESLGTSRYLNRAYDLGGDPGRGRLLLHVAYYTGLVDAVPHIPDRCMVAAGWDRLSLPVNHDLHLEWPEATVDPGPVNRRSGEPYRVLRVADPLTGAPEDVRLPQGTIELRVSGFDRDDQPAIAHYGGFCLIANHHVTAHPAAVRTLAFRPSEQHAYYAKVQLEMTVAASAGPERFVAMASDLMHELVPHLMRCLPDWQEVEAAQP